eukprot:COSAG06_NODE_2503_length_6752_cov_51.525778_8_plen_181_part_00
MLNSGDAFILLTPGKMWVWCVPTKTSPVELAIFIQTIRTGSDFRSANLNASRLECRVRVSFSFATSAGTAPTLRRTSGAPRRPPLTTCCRTATWYVLCCAVLSCAVMCCPVLSCPVLCCVVLCCVVGLLALVGWLVLFCLVLSLVLSCLILFPVLSCHAEILTRAPAPQHTHTRTITCSG